MSGQKHSLLLIATIALLVGMPALIPHSATAAMGTADLAVANARNARSLKYGKTMTLRFTVSNNGSDVASGVGVSFGVSDSFADLGATCPDGSISGFCDIGELAPGTSVTVDLRVGACCQCCPESVGVAVASVFHDANTVDPESANDFARVEVKLRGKPPF
jgi:hypothetical protein